MKLDCGIAHRRIASWLEGELSLDWENGAWTYAVADAACQVTATPLPSREFGNIALERTLVTINGDSEAIEEFYRLFTLRFISAGG